MGNILFNPETDKTRKRKILTKDEKNKLGLSIKKIAKEILDKDDEKAIGKMLGKLIYLLDQQINKTKKKLGFTPLIDEEKILKNTLEASVNHIKQRQLEAIDYIEGYVRMTLIYQYRDSLRNNNNPDNELNEEINKNYQEQLDFFHEGKIVLTDSQLRNIKDNMRRILRKHKFYILYSDKFDTYKKSSTVHIGHHKRVEQENEYISRLTKENRKEMYRFCLKQLDLKKKKMLLLNLNNHTQVRIAFRFGITKSRVCQILKDTKQNLSNCFAKYDFTKEDIKYVM